MKTLHKIIILSCILLSGVIAGCDNNQGALNTEKDLTPEEATLAASEANAKEQEQYFISTLKEIEKNLLEITTREGIILAYDKEGSQSDTPEKDRIMRNIGAINGLVMENRNKIEALNEQLRKNKYDGKRLNELLVDAQQKVRDYEEQVGDLKRQLSESDYRYAEIIKRIDEMTLTNQSLAQSVEWYDTELNTGYYIEGSPKELRKEGIVAKKGDLLGIGGAKVLNSDLEPSNFTKIDVRKTTVIPVNAKKARLVTGHEAGSYEFVKEGNMIASINIIDPVEFWKSSRYMVVETR